MIMEYQNLNYAMLPKEIKDRIKKYVPSARWRMPTIYSLMGHLLIQASRFKETKDYASWRAVENLGEKIMQWIESDPKRLKCYSQICEQKNSDESPSDPFFARG